MKKFILKRVHNCKVSKVDLKTLKLTKKLLLGFQGNSRYKRFRFLQAIYYKYPLYLRNVYSVNGQFLNISYSASAGALCTILCPVQKKRLHNKVIYITLHSTTCKGRNRRCTEMKSFGAPPVK